MRRFISMLFVYFFFLAQSQAAIILSRCSAPQTDYSLGSEIPPLPRESRQFTSSFAAVSALWNALDLNRAQTPRRQEMVRELSSHLDDVRVYWRARAMAWLTGENCQSAGYAIFTSALPYARGSTRADIRVGYEACSFIQDGEEQQPVRNTCRPIGRPEGYSIREIDERFAQINQSVAQFQYVLRGAILFGGVAASVRAGGLLWGARWSLFSTAASAWIRLGMTAIPAATAYAIAEHTDIPDMPIQNMIELRDAAKVLARGRLHAAAFVAQPIEDFELTLTEYLSTIRGPSIAVAAAPEAP